MITIMTNRANSGAKRRRAHHVQNAHAKPRPRVLNAARLERVFEAFGNRPDFPARLVRWIGSARHEAGATWLLRKCLQGRRDAGVLIADDVYVRAPSATDWQANLHLLQSIPLLPISDEKVSTVWGWLTHQSRSDRPFVRAWAYNGLHLVAWQAPEFRDRAKRRLAEGLEDPSAAVRARVRATLKEIRF